MKRAPSPCYKCKERYGGCHAECEPFKEWDKDDKERKAQEDVNRKAAIDAIGVVVDGSQQVKRYGGVRRNGQKS